MKKKVLFLLAIISSLSFSTTFITNSKSNKVNMRETPCKEAKVIETLNNNLVLVSNEKVGDYYKFTYYDSFVKKTFTGYISTEELKEIIGKMYVFSKDGYANIRENASTSSSIKNRIKNGEEIEVISKTDNSWFYVKFNNDYGYVHTTQLQKNKPIIKNRTIKTPFPNAKTQFPKKLLLNSSTGYSNIRIKPTQTSAIKTKLKTGTIVNVISKTDNGWFYIKFNNNQTGYIYENQVKKAD